MVARRGGWIPTGPRVAKFLLGTVFFPSERSMIKQNNKNLSVDVAAHLMSMGILVVQIGVPGSSRANVRQIARQADGSVDRRPNQQQFLRHIGLRMPAEKKASRFFRGRITAP
jgi:hypothetical protein